MASARLLAQNPSDFWLDSSNPALIRQDTSVSRTASAELYSSISTGGFHQTWEAPLSWNAGARTQALVHFKDISLAGSFAFDQMQGNQMCGSMMVRPGYYPVDVLEFTPGKKNRQTYSFTGAISADISTHWRIGAGIDFTSANYSKRKDLRHSNYFLDLNFSPGFVWHDGDISVGANLRIGKNSDTPVANQIGSKETFDAFLDKGLMFGRLEIWDGSGVHLADAGSTGFPLREMIYGAGFQFQKKQLYSSLDSGYAVVLAGEQQQVWFRFPSHNLKLDLGGTVCSPGESHSIRLKADWKRLDNNENVLDKYTDGGITYYKKVASIPILHYDNVGIAASYVFEDGSNHISAELSEEFRATSSFVMYPFVTERFTEFTTIEVHYIRTLKRFDLGVLLGCRRGSVKETQRQSAGDSGVVGEPFRLTQWDEKEVEWIRAPRLKAGIDAKCRIWRGMYLKVDAGYVRAFGISALEGPNRFHGEFSIGYNF